MNLGIIAHNSKKVLIEDFCIAYKNILAKHEVCLLYTSGIGFATSDKFLKEGASVVLAASSQESADVAVDKLKEKYPNAICLLYTSSSAVEKMGFRRSCSIITQRQGQSSMRHLSYRGSADIWRLMDTRVITICRISNDALAGHLSLIHI